MSRHWLLVVSLVCFVTIFSAHPARAQVSSTFSADAEGWRLIGQNVTAWQAAGGNPGGCVKVSDIAGHGYVTAPVAYLGDWSGFDGADTLSASLYLDNTSGGATSNPWVFRIAGPGGAAYAFDGPSYVPPHRVWTTYRVSLAETDWTIESGTWSEIVANVTSLRLNVEFVSGAEIDYFDSVSLSGTPGAPPVPCLATTFNDGSFGDWSFENVTEATLSATGGNGAGYAWVGDFGDVNSYGYAPPGYLGDWSSLDGVGYLTVDIRVVSFTGSNLGSPTFIRLSGPGGAAYVGLSTWEVPGNRRLWRTFQFALDEGVWTLESGTWSGLLAHVTECRIDLEYYFGGETIGIDNFGRASIGCPAIDQPAQAQHASASLLRRFSLIDIYGVALNPFDYAVYGVVNKTANEGGGLYRITGPDPGERMQAYESPAHLIFDVDGDCFISEALSGNVYRLAWQDVSSLWVSGFHSGDDDPVGMAFAPTGFDGPSVNPGDVLVADIGSNGPDEIWAFSPDSSEGERLLMPDPGNVDICDVASAPGGEVYFCDALDPNNLYRLDALGARHALALSTPVTGLSSVVYDGEDSLLYVASIDNDSVYRVDPRTGEVALMADGFSAFGYCNLEFDTVNRRLWVADMGYNRVYEFLIGGVVTVQEDTAPRLATVALYVAPNPFNPSTHVRFDLDTAAAVSLVLYDVAGRRVRTLYDGHLGPGPQAIPWDGRDHHGQPAASGVYFVRLSTPRTTAVARMVLVR